MAAPAAMVDRMRKLLLFVLLASCTDASDIEHHLGHDAICSGDDDIYQCVVDGKPVSCVVHGHRIACYDGVAPGIKHEDNTVIITSPPPSR